jgi:hypothetical protein
MTHTQTLVIHDEHADEFETNCIAVNKDLPKNYKLFDGEVEFDNGLTMAIQMYTDEDPSKYACWTQGVLYCDGNEINCTEVQGSLFQEFTIMDDGDVYVVKVIRFSQREQMMRDWIEIFIGKAREMESKSIFDEVQPDDDGMGVTFKKDGTESSMRISIS